MAEIKKTYMSTILIIAVGGAIGAALRYLTGLGALKLSRKPKVYTGTVIVNIIGCFAAGLIVGWIDKFDPEITDMVLFLTIGILGSYTTFSTFALEALHLFQDSMKSIFTYLFLQVVVAIASVAIGYGLVFWLSVIRN